MNTHFLTVTTQPHLCPLPCEDCTLKLEISGSSSLHDLAELILKSIGFDFDHPFGFYDNLKNAYASKESYTLFSDLGESEDGEPGVSDTTVASVFTPRKKMIFLFDYGDDWQFLVACDDAKPSDSKKKVARRVSIEGTPPEQYPDFDDE